MTKDLPSCSTATASIDGDQAAVTIRYMDYAAWAMLRVILRMDGSAIHPDPIILTLPHDANGDRIADHWQHGEARRWNHQFRLEASNPNWVNVEDPETWTAIFGNQGVADAELADSDGPDGPMPAMADDGDGLTALEEYRGFFLDGGPATTTPRHRRLSVARKDLLVECSEMEGIASTTLRLPSDANANFTDQGNDPNAFAQAYSLAPTMSRISAFFAQEGPSVGNNPKYFPGAAIDIWWVTDKLNDMG